MQKQDITPTVSTTYTPGAILCDQWGFEQTNHDFYCILTRSGMWLTLLPMVKDVKPGDPLSMETKDTPTEIDWSKKPIRKLLKQWHGEEQGFSFRNYSGGGWCRLWSGKTQTSTHYA